MQKGLRPSLARAPALYVLRRLGLATNLRLCLDAGDAASYTSGQKWLDTSGNGYDFFLGLDGSATATDPTFNGTAGGLSSAEYFSFDGADYFTYDTTNETWMENLHKDNAIFTFMAWVYIGAQGSSQGLFGNNAATNTNIGIVWQVASSNVQALTVTNGTAASMLQTSSTTVPAGSWLCLGASLNEATGAGGIIWFQNGVTNTDTSTYTSPSASGATFTSAIGSRGNANGILTNNSRMAMFMAWEAALSLSQMTAFYNATRGRFGI